MQKKNLNRISLWALNSKSTILIFQKSPNFWKFLDKLEQVKGVLFYYLGYEFSSSDEDDI